MDSRYGIFLFLLFIIFTNRTNASSSITTISYTNHCAYLVPEAAPTTTMYTVYPFLELLTVTSYFHGGERILGKNHSYGHAKSLHFAATTNIFMTNVDGVLKIEAHLIFKDPNAKFYVLSNTTSNLGSLDFLLNGFWSVPTKKLCMVGSAAWYSSEGESINLEAVLKLNISSKPTVHTSLINGVLESLASSSNDPSYFEPISILGFPRVTPNEYNYTLVSEDGCSDCNLAVKASLRLNYARICDMFSGQFLTYKLKYPSGCNSVNPLPNCTPFGTVSGNLPSILSLYAIQCSRSERKLRYLVGFHKSIFVEFGSSFDPNTTLIGEGVWDVRKNQLCLVLCRILNPDDPSGNAHPGDCSIRLTLRYCAVWSMMKIISIEGEIWSNKTANDVGYFEKIKFQSIYDGMDDLPGVKYEYTLMEGVKKSCPVRKPLEKKGETYRDGDSPGMRFDLFLESSKRYLCWGLADPITLGTQFFDAYTVPAIAASTHYSRPVNISYKISFSPPNKSFKFHPRIFSLNKSLSPFGEVVISAEGVYDDRSGHLCMVGCRRLFPNESYDCEILVKINFPPENGDGKERLIKGSIESLRSKGDSLYFDRLDVISISNITSLESRRNIWRMDLEILMVFISYTLTCVFVGLQILHVKKHSDVLPFISLTMLLMLALSHLIPLFLKFEYLNEVFSMFVTMVAFMLEFRLFQMVWTAKLKDGNGKEGAWVTEIKTLFVLLLLYIIGGSIVLLVNWKKNKYSTTTRADQFVGFSQHHSVWGNLRSYAGLVLDGFLFPQILLNIFQSSKGSSLSPSFYVGSTFVRSLPHAYDLYRGNIQNQTGHQFDRFYIYANPRADFYSPSWDVVIACGGILLVGIIGLQQHYGGHFFLPQKFRQLSEEYEMVPVSSS